MLSVAIEDLGDVVALRCVGRIVAGREGDILRGAVLSQSKARTVVLDLRHVEAIDGGGLGLLVFLQASTHAAGAENPGPVLKRVTITCRKAAAIPLRPREFTPVATRKPRGVPLRAVSAV